MIFTDDGNRNGKRKGYGKVIAIILAVLLLFSGIMLVMRGVNAKYATKAEQTVKLIIHPTMPVLAEKGTWYRAETPKSDIASVTIVTHDYILTEDDYEEAFYADAFNKGTIKAYITKDADDKLHLILSGNGYNDSDAVYANVDSSELFAGFTGAKTFTGMNNIDMTDALDISSAFSGCANAATISGTGAWNTAKVEDMSNVFAGCAKLTAADVSGWSTAKAETFENMFSDCALVGTVNLSSFSFESAETTANMFANCGALYSVTMPETPNTENVTDMSGMFNGTTALTAVDVSGFDTTNLESMNGMFKASGVQSLDLSGWNTENVTDMEELFSGCADLASVKASQNFVPADNDTDMFAGCAAIVGEHGTVYSAEHTDGEYARIDTTNVPGYFKGATLKITFDANGGDGEKTEQYVLSGVEDTIVKYDDEFTKAHYFFGGWNSKADGTGTAFDDEDEITVTEDTTL